MFVWSALGPDVEPASERQFRRGPDGFAGMLNLEPVVLVVALVLQDARGSSSVRGFAPAREERRGVLARITGSEAQPAEA